MAGMLCLVYGLLAGAASGGCPADFAKALVLARIAVGVIAVLAAVLILALGDETDQVLKFVLMYLFLALMTVPEAGAVYLYVRQAQLEKFMSQNSEWQGGMANAGPPDPYAGQQWAQESWNQGPALQPQFAVRDQLVDMLPMADDRMFSFGLRRPRGPVPRRPAGLEKRAAAVGSDLWAKAWGLEYKAGALAGAAAQRRRQRRLGVERKQAAAKELAPGTWPADTVTDIAEVAQPPEDLSELRKKACAEVKESGAEVWPAPENDRLLRRAEAAPFGSRAPAECALGFHQASFMLKAISFALLWACEASQELADFVEKNAAPGDIDAALEKFIQFRGEP
ncbi:unnamed protein product [Effrenium voratum]|nr:unnamed protein product [Effrenium voratum]